MKKTSRRTFGKQLTGALAALPLVTTSIGAQQNDQEKRPSQKAQEKVFKEHDTPPPVLVAEGSLTVETTDPFDRTSPALTGRQRRTVSAYSSLKLAHIKIVDGSGEMLYRNDKPPLNCEIRIKVNDGTELKFGQITGGLYLDMDDDKDLGNPQNISGHKRPKLYRPKKANRELEIQAITVAESDAAGAPFLFKVTEAELNSHLKESRVMIWLEQ